MFVRDDQKPFYLCFVLRAKVWVVFAYHGHEFGCGVLEAFGNEVLPLDGLGELDHLAARASFLPQ